MIKDNYCYNQQNIKINYTTPCSVKDKKQAASLLFQGHFPVVQRGTISEGSIAFS